MLIAQDDAPPVEGFIEWVLTLIAMVVGLGILLWVIIMAIGLVGMVISFPIHLWRNRGKNE